MTQQNYQPQTGIDADEQTRLFIIEEALRDVGYASTNAPVPLSTELDEQLYALIDSVPLE